MSRLLLAQATLGRHSLLQHKQKRGLYFRKILFRYVCDSGRIQTCNLLIRSQMLYSVELRSQTLLLYGSVVP